MRRGIIALIIIVSFVVGLAAGFGGGYYHYVVGPQKEAQEMAKKQQEELNKMVRHGEVVDVKPEQITVHVTKAQLEQGKTVTYRTNEYTSVQIGMGFVNKPNEKTDLTKWFQKGDQVDLLVKNGQVMALHRELRPGEQVPQTVGQPAPSSQETGQQASPAPAPAQQ
jgi:hypothetical protein